MAWFHELGRVGNTFVDYGCREATIRYVQARTFGYKGNFQSSHALRVFVLCSCLLKYGFWPKQL